MDGVLRGLAIYIVLLAFFRAIGNRSVGQITVFDFVLLLIISETTQQALIGDDFSVTQCLVLVATLMGADLVLSRIKQRFPRLDLALEGHPIMLVQDGKLLEDRLKRERVDVSDVLEAAREAHGIASLQGIRHAILERDGNISVVPRDKPQS
jgi:uncharacterized membrane protein YcaP (DUF421 family)